MAQLERPPQHADHIEAIAEHVGKRSADVTGRTRQPENSVRLVVHQREGAIAVNGDDTVAHAADDVAEEPVVGSHTADTPPNRRRPGSAATQTRVGGLGCVRHVGALGSLFVTRQLDSIRGKRCAEPRSRMCEERPIKSSGYEKPYE